MPVYSEELKNLGAGGSIAISFTTKRILKPGNFRTKQECLKLEFCMAAACPKQVLRGTCPRKIYRER